MSNRPRRRRHAGHATPDEARRRAAAQAAGLLQRATSPLTPQDLGAADTSHLDGDPMVLTQPGATDGTPDSIADAKRLTHDELIAATDAAGIPRLGPVCWYEWGPADVPDALAHLSAQDPRYRQFHQWFTDHPDGTLVLAAVVALPPPGTADGAWHPPTGT